MALTRFYDDDARVKKQLEESLNVGLYGEIHKALIVEGGNQYRIEYV